jgi:polar amino acid transport system substrate-binding protein
MKKILVATLILLIHSVTLAKDKKEYSFIMQEYAPFNWTDGDTLKGGMLEVVKGICQKMKITCKFASLPMKRVISMLEDGSTDAVLSLLPNSDREAFTILSSPIINSNMSYFAVKGTFKKTKNLLDLNGATVGAVATSSAEKMALSHKEKLKDFTIVSETGLPVVMNKLSAGRYGAKGLAFSNQDAFTTSLKNSNIENIEVIYIAKRQGFRVAFSRKTIPASFVQDFNAQIHNMKKTGELKKYLQPFGLMPSP